MEMHLSDCAITSDGFEALMTSLETSDAYPCPDLRFPDRSVPLYLRLENNYINEESIKAKVEEGTVCTFRKQEQNSSRQSDAKCRILLRDNGSFAQREGPPPAPEDAPPPKPVREKGKGEKGKGKDKGGKSGKGKDSKGKGKSEEAPWRRAAEDRKGGGKGKGVAALPGREVQRTIEKPTGKGSGKGGRYASAMPSSAYDRAAPSRAVAKAKTVFTPRANGKSAEKESSGGKGTAKGKETSGGKGKGKGLQTGKLPYPWEEHWSDEFGLAYYWNAKTGESLWEKPRA